MIHTALAIMILDIILQCIDSKYNDSISTGIYCPHRYLPMRRVTSSIMHENITLEVQGIYPDNCRPTVTTTRWGGSKPMQRAEGKVLFL